MAPAKSQADNISAASPSEAVRQVLSDAQDALDKAVQVSHTQDPPVALQEVSAKSQVDNISVASQSEVVLQVRSDVQDAQDRAVQVSHTPDPPVLMAVVAKSPADNISAASQSAADHQAQSDAQEIPAATQSDVQDAAAPACPPHTQDLLPPTQCPLSLPASISRYCP